MVQDNLWLALNQGTDRRELNRYFIEISKEQAYDLFNSTAVFGVDYQGYEAQIFDATEIENFEMFAIEK